MCLTCKLTFEAYTSAVWRVTRPVANRAIFQKSRTRLISKLPNSHDASDAEFISEKLGKNNQSSSKIHLRPLSCNQIEQHQNKENLKDTKNNFIKNSTKSDLDIKHNYVHNLYEIELFRVLKHKILENYTFLNGIVPNKNTNPQNLEPLQIIDENKNIYATFNVHSFNKETLDSSISKFLKRDDVQKILKDGVESFYNTYMQNNTLDTSKLGEHILQTANELLSLFYK